MTRPRFLLNSFFLSGEFRRSFHPPVSRGIPHLVVILFYFFIYLVQEEMKKELVDITLPAQLQKLETILKDHNEGKGFFLGDKVGGENFS